MEPAGSKHIQAEVKIAEEAKAAGANKSSLRHDIKGLERAGKFFEALFKSIAFIFCRYSCETVGNTWKEFWHGKKISVIKRIALPLKFESEDKDKVNDSMFATATPVDQLKETAATPVVQLKKTAATVDGFKERQSRPFKKDAAGNDLFLDAEKTKRVRVKQEELVPKVQTGVVAMMTKASELSKSLKDNPDAATSLEWATLITDTRMFAFSSTNYKGIKNALASVDLNDPNVKAQVLAEVEKTQSDNPVTIAILKKIIEDCFASKNHAETFKFYDALLNTKKEVAEKEKELGADEKEKAADDTTQSFGLVGIGDQSFIYEQEPRNIHMGKENKLAWASDKTRIQEMIQDQIAQCSNPITKEEVANVRQNVLSQLEQLKTDFSKRQATMKKIEKQADAFVATLTDKDKTRTKNGAEEVMKNAYIKNIIERYVIRKLEGDDLLKTFKYDPEIVKLGERFLAQLAAENHPDLAENERIDAFMAPFESGIAYPVETTAYAHNLLNLWQFQVENQSQ